MSIEIVPTGAALGAEIRGVNLARSHDDTTFAAIERAYNQYGVIFFRGQDIAPPQQVAFTRRFGEIEFNIFGERWSVPGSPEIVVVSNVTEDGQPIGVRRAGENWHSDMCYAPRPPRGTMLYALEIPDLFGLSLGDTEFASAAAAWDALPEPLRRIEGRRAVFDFAGRNARRLHRDRGHRAGGSRGADRRASRSYRQAGLHLPPPVAARRSAAMGQLHGAASGDPGLRSAAPAADASHDHGRHRSDLTVRRALAASYNSFSPTSSARNAVGSTNWMP